MVLIANTIYGAVLIVLHAILLGEAPLFKKAKNVPKKEQHWFLQFMDLDLSWGHRLLGFREEGGLVAGLLYGLTVVGVSAFALNLLFVSGHAGHSGVAVPKLTLKWYVVFMHVQLVLYLAVSLAKFALLCKLREEHFPALENNCSMLRYLFAERFCYGLVGSSLCLWIFGSFAYLKGAHGNDEDFDSDDSELGEKRPTTRGLQVGQRGYNIHRPGGTALPTMHSVPPKTRSVNVQPHGHSSSFSPPSGTSYIAHDSIPRSFTHATNGGMSRAGSHAASHVPVASSFSGGGRLSGSMRAPLAAF